MKLNKFLTIPIMALLLWLTGCKGDEPVNPEPMVEQPTLTFRLALSSENLGTRGDVNDAEDHKTQTWTPTTGSDPNAVTFDNNLNSLRVVLYKVVGTDSRLNYEYPVAELTNISYDKTDYDGVVVVSGKLNSTFTAAELEGAEHRLVVFVNPPLTLDIKNPGDCVFSEHGNSKAFSGGLPMYGVADVDFTGLSSHSGGDFQLKGSDGQDLSISILRSVAKIKVQLSNDLYKGVDKGGKNVRLISMIVSHHAQTGYICPEGWDTVSTFAGLTHNSVMRPVSNAGYDTECTITPYQGDDADDTWMNSEKMLRFYCPDTFNNDAKKPIKLTINYKVGDDSDVRSDDIYLCQYKDGVHDTGDDDHKRFDIIRNHIYLFTITKVKDNFKLQCEVSIQKWGYHKIKTEL